MSSNIPQNAASQSRSNHPDPIPSHALPDTPSNTIIIGVCGVSEENAHPSKQGWSLSDFCALNYLLKGVGRRQLWISPTSEDRLLHLINTDVDYQPGLLHGYPWKDRKIVFNADLVNRDELTPWTVLEPSAIKSRTLEEIRTACEEAKEETPNWSIILLLFGHGHESLGVQLDDTKDINDAAGHLSLQELQQVIDPAIQLTVVTSACHSRDWAMTQDLNAAVLAAARSNSTSHQTRFPSENESWPCSPRHQPDGSVEDGRACGLVFAATLTSALAESTNIAAVEGNQDKLTSAPSVSAAKSLTYNEFCHAMVRTLGKDMHQNPEWRAFHFAAQDDFWGRHGLGRTNVPLRHYTRRWADLPVLPTALETSPCNQDRHSSCHQAPKLTWNGCVSACNPDPKSPWNTGGVADKVRWGVLTGASVPRNEPELGICALPLHHGQTSRQELQRMAGMLARSCYGEWDGGGRLHLRGRFASYSQSKEDALAQEERIVVFLTFCFQAAALVDGFVDKYRLLRPCGQKCLEWNSLMWHGACSDDLDERQKKIDRLLWQEPLLLFRPPPSRFSFGTRFSRPVRYLSASLTLSPISIDEVQKTILLMVEDLRSMAQHYERIVRGEEWFRSSQKVDEPHGPVNRTPSDTVYSANGREVQI